MKPLLLKQVVPSGILQNLYLVAFLSDYTSLGRTTKEPFNLLVFAGSDYDAEYLAKEFMSAEYSQSTLVSNWVIKETCLIPSDFIVHAYNNLPFNKAK
jgi:hypothetical protein